MSPRTARAAQAVPPLAEREQPGLSVTLEGPKHPARCQSCGVWGRDPLGDEIVGHNAAADLRRWIECDAWDRHDARSPVVVLCAACSDRLIAPHPRLYVPLSPDTPHPGSMLLCLACRHRQGVRCGHPAAKANGGEGVGLSFGGRQPTQVHLNYGGGRGEMKTLYPRVTACRQYELATPTMPDRGSHA